MFHPHFLWFDYSHWQSSIDEFKFLSQRKRGRPPVVRSQAFKNRMLQKMDLLDSAGRSDDDDFVPTVGPLFDLTQLDHFKIIQ
jgi:hypothetical protein